MRHHFLSTVAVLASVAMVAFAQPPGRGMGPRDLPPRHEALLKELNLTDAQKAQVQKLHLEMMKKQTQLRSKIQTLRLDTKGLFLAEKVDRSAIEKNIKAITEAQEQMKMAMLDHWFAVNALLTPEQQKVWKEHAMQFGERMRQRFGQGRPMMRHRFGGPPDYE